MTPASFNALLEDVNGIPPDEYDGIARWMRDSGNAAGEGDDGWSWDPDTRVCTITNEDGSTSEFTGAEIAASSPDDHRLDRLREE
jgi:hypothetical protein